MGIAPKSVPPNGQTTDVPLWRQHFPIDAEDDARRTRRAFLEGLTVAGGVMACGQVAFRQVVLQDAAEPAWSTPPPVALEKRLTDLEVGEAWQFHFPDERSPCLLVRLSDQEFVAFQQKCTHLACPVIPDVEQAAFHCPCHHGAFDLQTGEPLAGPPRRALPRVLIEVASDGTLTATGVEMT